MFNLFKKKSHRLQFGLINCLNNRGLGTESRLLKVFFAEHFPEVDFHIYKIPPGRRGKAFDSTSKDNKGFQRWLENQHIVMTVETFMPNVYESCREKGIKALWRPNQEWIDPHYAKADFEKLDYIMTPQEACADFLEQKYDLKNVIRNPWITELPITNKSYKSKEKTTFLFNAGRGGIGNRRNHEVVIQAFANVLAERPDIEFTLKTQVELDVSALNTYRGKNFSYICKNTNYKKNLGYYKNADFSLAPSKWEGVGFALLESLYCGTPVITTDAPPMNEWVQHKETGYLVKTRFPDVPLPIPYDRVNQNGLHWVKAAMCSTEDLAAGIIWLADKKESIYEGFNEKNRHILEQRKDKFIETFKNLLNK